MTPLPKIIFIKPHNFYKYAISATKVVSCYLSTIAMQHHLHIMNECHHSPCFHNFCLQPMIISEATQSSVLDDLLGKADADEEKVATDQHTQLLSFCSAQAVKMMIKLCIYTSGETLCRDNCQLIGMSLIGLARQVQKNRD